jgi:Zn-dependent protease with chaperone function
MQVNSNYRSDWLVLYGVTLALEVPVILARYLAAWLAIAVLLKVTGGSTAGAEEWAKLAAIAPMLWSIAALMNPAGGGWWWQQRMGGREPSKREHEAYVDALTQLQNVSALLLPRPKRWFVVDEAACNAAVCGDTLMLSKGLLESSHLPAILAHELGHLQGIDARLAAAVNRLAIDRLQHPQAKLEEGGAASPPLSPTPFSTARAATPPATPPTTVVIKQETRSGGLIGGPLHWILRMSIALLRGGLGLRITAPLWAQIWREQEYEADRWAAHLGQADELADFLERETLAHDHPTPLVWLTNHTHPPTELRIERLRAAAQKPNARET